MKHQDEAPREEAQDQSQSQESAKEAYETPKVESVQLSPEAAEALT